MKKGDLCRESIHGISRERISGFKEQRGEDDLNGLARYLWNMDLSAAVSPALNTFEVCFRNAVYRSVANYRSDIIWLTNGSILINKDQEKVVEAMNRVRQERSTKYRHHPDYRRINRSPINVNDVIPKMTLGFWHGLFKGDYASVIAAACLDIGGELYLLKPEFNDHQGVMDRIKPILDFRNRIAHHEPIWRDRHKAKHCRDEAVRYTRVISPVNVNLSGCVDKFDSILSNGWEIYRDKIEEDLIDLQPFKA